MPISKITFFAIYGLLLRWVFVGCSWNEIWLTGGNYSAKSRPIRHYKHLIFIKWSWHVFERFLFFKCSENFNDKWVIWLLYLFYVHCLVLTSYSPNHIHICCCLSSWAQTQFSCSLSFLSFRFHTETKCINDKRRNNQFNENES